MCGINGYDFHNEQKIKNMMQFTFCRGPDAHQIYSDEDITFAHDRLSIIDLDSRSNQPFLFKNYVLSFNGEIYNYKNLKEKLKNQGIKFQTTSDTEVIIKLFDKYQEDSFKMLSGIFAISIWDKQKKTLYLIRDIMGVKPLYYYVSNKNEIYFSSSIRSILSIMENYELNSDANFYFQNMGRNDLKETFFKNIYKLLPGELLIKKKNSKPQLIKFLNFQFENKFNSKFDIKHNIKKIIKKQLVADVPVALSISGGVDSNIIYSVLRENLNRKNYSLYSFYYPEYEKFNEDFRVANNNANYFKDKIIPIKINHKDFIENIEKVVEIMEEPLRNESAIMNYMMSKNVKEKVLFLGDGGDEVFTGYDQYKSIFILDLLTRFNFFSNKEYQFKNKLLRRLFLKNPISLYLSFSDSNLMQNKHLYFKNFKYLKNENILLNHVKNVKFKEKLNYISLLDLDTRVPNDFLMRNDKIFMNYGIESRVPFLDEEMINYFLNFPVLRKFDYLFKSKGMLKKYFLKDINSTCKKKWGLQSPIGKFLRRELNYYLKEILSKSYYANSSNYLNFENIHKLIDQHKIKYSDPYMLWTLLVYQIFLRKFKL